VNLRAVDAPMESSPNMPLEVISGTAIQQRMPQGAWSFSRRAPPRCPNEDALAFNEHALEQGVIRGVERCNWPSGWLLRHFPRDEKMHLILGQDYARAIVWHQIRKAGEESIEDGIHRQILRKSSVDFRSALVSACAASARG